MSDKIVTSKVEMMTVTCCHNNHPKLEYGLRRMYRVSFTINEGSRGAPYTYRPISAVKLHRVQFDCDIVGLS